LRQENNDQRKAQLEIFRLKPFRVMMVQDVSKGECSINKVLPYRQAFVVTNVSPFSLRMLHLELQHHDTQSRKRRLTRSKVPETAADIGNPPPTVPVINAVHTDLHWETTKSGHPLNIEQTFDDAIHCLGHCCRENGILVPSFM
jgi:hypothetical protein